MQQLLVECECGRKTPVTSAQCGGRVACLCGRSVDVPRLRQLRTENGLDNRSALDKLNVLGRSGPIRSGVGCVFCSIRQGDTHEILLECQKPQIIGESNWVTNLIVIVFGGIGKLLHLAEQRQITASGDERLAQFAIEICTDCFERNARRKRQLKAAIRRIPEINDVFLEYPDSEVCQVT